MSNADDQPRLIEPVRLSQAVAGGTELEHFEPWPAGMQQRRVGRHALKVWFEGEHLTAMVYQAEEGQLRFESLPYDEHVYVLSGGAVLETDAGERHDYGPGDVFVVPKGWSGTWEFLKDYRELVVFETSSVNAAMNAWFGWE
ncbi:cupin domain-containing protein [Parahaliea maris]|uniref:Cupin domain-containing protein n=1 Tax=Parahaliea maris TaxID=2716870 RepID=A0A5C8ZTN4_9GAMM|nr:cupin domain-containing protein [Parahaliea maris]TXS91858.1 cupin domain-containing protein [Parahaliea maris]